MLKVLVITNMYPTINRPVFGLFIKNIVKELKKKGIYSNIVFSEPPIKYVKIFLKSFLSKKYDVIHAHYVFPCGFIGALLKTIRGGKLIITSHGSDITTTANNNFIYNYLTKFSLKKADKIIVVSSFLRKKVENLNIDNNKISVVPCGVDTNIFRPMNKKKCRKILGIKTNEQIILFAGTITEEKNPEIFINLAKKMKNYKFILIGEGWELKNKILSHNLPNIIIKPPVKQKKLAIWMNASNCIILPSKTEGFGLVLIEAMACKIPVIGSNIGGIPNIIENNKTGIITNDFTNAIKKIHNKKFVKKITNNAFNKVKYNYTWDIISNKILKIYIQVTKKHFHDD